MRSSSGSRRSRSTCRCCATWASSRCGATGGGLCIGPTQRRSARFTTGARCSAGTGADSCDASRHTPRRNDDDDSTARGHQTFTITEEIQVRASLEKTFASLIVQMGRQNETPDGKPLPMILEPHPGGRWFRDLGGDNGHLWGFVQSIKRPVLLEIWGPLFMSTAATSNLLYRLTRDAEGTLITFTHTLVGPVPRRPPPAARHRDGPRCTRACAPPRKPPRTKETRWP